VTSPDQGEILINGQPIRIHGPLGAQSHGIQTVYQDLALFDNLSVTANLFLGREKVKGRILNERDMEDAARKTFDRLNVKTVDSVRRTVGVMSGGQRQVVAIARAVLADSKVVLLDEPTAALGVEQTAMVLQLVRNLCNQGIGVILVSHSLPHVMEVSDRISVLRLGRWVADFDTSKTNTEEIVSAITGSLTHVKH
jgi:ABC-type sugar transport system ATPase subunit